MTTVTISDALAARLRALHNYDQGDDFNKLVEVALDEAARRWEWEAAGRAEMAAMLNGPRRPFDPQATYQRDREKYGWAEDVSNLSNEELTSRFEAGATALSAEQRAEAERLGFL